MTATSPRATHLDLFSGIAGFALAARWAGYETVQFCEIDSFCQTVIAKNFPGVPIHDDITNFDGRPFRGRIGLLTGGFPCQQISVAGGGEGLIKADGTPTDKSGLWFELLRVIRECRPDRIVVENVPALRTRGIDTVLEGLEEAGYTCWPLVVGADDVGATHRRKRVWIVGVANSYNSQPCSGNKTIFTRRHSVVTRGNSMGDTSHKQSDIGGLEGLAETSGRSECVRSAVSDAGAELADADSSGRREPGRCESVSAEQLATECACGDLVCNQRATFDMFPPGPDDMDGWRRVHPQYWPVELEIHGALNGIPGWVVRSQVGKRREILKGLGNSIVPQVAYCIICALDSATSTPISANPTSNL